MGSFPRRGVVSKLRRGAPRRRIFSSRGAARARQSAAGTGWFSITLQRDKGGGARRPGRPAAATCRCASCARVSQPLRREQLARAHAFVSVQTQRFDFAPPPHRATTTTASLPVAPRSAGPTADASRTGHHPTSRHSPAHPRCDALLQ